MASKAEVTVMKKRKNHVEGEAPSQVDSVTSPPRRIPRSSTSTPLRSAVVGEARGRRVYEIFEREKKSRLRVEGGQKKLESMMPALGRAIKLPPRLMDLSEVPLTGKVTTYSNPEHLLSIKGTLGGGKYYKALRNSPLGTVFDIQVKKAAMSGRLVHSMLCRTLLTRKRHELWLVIANKPIRFSLKEFALLTGLLCGPYPPTADIKKLRQRSESKDAYWNELMVGRLATGLINDIVDLLWGNDDLRDERANIPMPTRLRLCLVVLVDGVLCGNGPSAVKASRLTVEMVKDVESFLAFPWGRFSFELTLEMARVGSSCNETIEALVKRLARQSSICLKGFPVAFQLLFYATVPAFNRVVIPNPSEDLEDFASTAMEKLDVNRVFTNDIINQVDKNPETQVISLLEHGYDLAGVDLSWGDELEDSLVDNVLSKIQEGFVFTKENWKKGLIDIPPASGVAELAKKQRAPSRRSGRAPRRSTRTNGRQMRQKTGFMDPSKIFVHNPEDPLNDFFFTVMNPRWNEKTKRDAKYRQESDNQFFAEVMNDLIENTRAQKILVGEYEAGGSSAASGEGEASSDSVEELMAPKDVKGKGKVGQPSADEGVEIHSEDDYIIRKLGEGTSRVRQPSFEETPAPQEKQSGIPAFTWAELMEIDSQEEDEEMAATDAFIDQYQDDVVIENVPVGEIQRSTDNGKPASPRKTSTCGLEGKLAGKEVENQGPNLELDYKECGFNAAEEWKVNSFFKAIESFNRKQYYINETTVPRSTFREIATKGTNVCISHMELMLALVWSRLSEKLRTTRAVILDTKFLPRLLKDEAKFQQNQANPFEWHKNLEAIVHGTYAKRMGSTKWVVDVDRVYAPMQWSDSHWVALCIDLVSGKVTVFDSNMNLHSDDEADEEMAPVLKMLPMLIADLGPSEGNIYNPPTSFVFERPNGVPQFPDRGDGGPVSVKYIELHSQGFPVDVVKDEVVASLRLNYAIGVYETFYNTLS